MDASQLRFNYRFDIEEDTARVIGRHGGGDPHQGTPSLGKSPTLTWTPHTPEPWKLYARATLRCSEPSAVASVTFTIERGVMKVLRSRDVVHLCATPLPGLCILREGRLIAAAGAAVALASIPLGNVSVTIVDPASVRIQVGAGEQYRADNFPLSPVRVCIDGVCESLWRGRPTIAGYDVFTRVGRAREPWLSLEQKNVCAETAAHTTSELLDRHPPEIIDGRG